MSRSNYRNLIIIGNGFDCWQGIPTSYEKFRVYYNEHIAEVASKLVVCCAVSGLSLIHI